MIQMDWARRARRGLLKPASRARRHGASPGTAKTRRRS